MDEALKIDKEIVMKLLHYFITEKNYNPIILQGIKNEIWLENLQEEYKVVRIVSNYIHNDEQMNIDINRTDRIISKIKMKTFSLSLKVLSIYIDISDRVNLESSRNNTRILIKTEKDLKKYDNVMEVYPDIIKKCKFTEDGLELFLKITEEITEKNMNEARKNEEVFKTKKPIITFILIFINVVIFLFSSIFENESILLFANNKLLVRDGEYYRLFTSMFLHADIVHLLCNMYSLYIVGSQVENYFGKKNYIIIYLFSGIIGNLFSVLTGVGDAYSVGASGAIFGLLGAILSFGYFYRVYLGNVLMSQIIPIIILNLLIGFSVEGIDNSAHIGGLIGGMLSSTALGVRFKEDNTLKMNYRIVTIVFTIVLIYFALFL